MRKILVAILVLFFLPLDAFAAGSAANFYTWAIQNKTECGDFTIETRKSGSGSKTKTAVITYVGTVPVAYEHYDWDGSIIDAAVNYKDMWVSTKDLSVGNMFMTKLLALDQRNAADASSRLCMARHTEKLFLEWNKRLYFVE